MKQSTQKLRLLGAMSIFGTLGIFVRYIPLSSAMLALVRGILGCLFLLGFLAVRKKPLSGSAIREHALLLCLSGAALGGNWILLFEAYRYTTVATATVCYYLAPLFLLLVSPLLGEHLTGKKLLCIGLATVGMVLVSGVLRGGVPQRSECIGIALGVGAAVLYAAVMLLNKKLGAMPPYEKTLVQLAVGAAVVLPYALLTGGLHLQPMRPLAVGALLVVGFVHTGVAYILYFGALGQLDARTVAVFSYLDPVLAVVLSALLLREPMDALSIAGTVLILGSALYSELPGKFEKITKRG